MQMVRIIMQLLLVELSSKLFVQSSCDIHFGRYGARELDG